jgi:hypothetical protein
MNRLEVRMFAGVAALLVFCAGSGVTEAADAPTAAKVAADTAHSASAACGRRCLLEVLTEYTEALVDNNTSRLQVSPEVRVTGNGALLKLGKGEVWGAVKRIAYRQAFVDPVTGAAVFYGVSRSTEPLAELPPHRCICRSGCSMPRFRSANGRPAKSSLPRRTSISMPSRSSSTITMCPGTRSASASS